MGGGSLSATQRGPSLLSWQETVDDVTKHFGGGIDCVANRLFHNVLGHTLSPFCRAPSADLIPQFNYRRKFIYNAMYSTKIRGLLSCPLASCAGAPGTCEHTACSGPDAEDGKRACNPSYNYFSLLGIAYGSVPGCHSARQRSRIGCRWHRPVLPVVDTERVRV